MASITVIGPGAVGGTVAAWLALNNTHEVRVCARTPFDRLVVDTPDRGLIAAPAVFTHPDQATPSDWILIATKAYDVAGTVRWLPNLLGEHTRVAILQNGVEHIQRFAPFVDVSSLVPVVVDLPAERKGPGHILQRGNGYLVAPDDDNGRDFAGLFSHTVLNASTTADWPSRAWRKLALNCTGAVPALLLSTVDARENPDIADLLRALIRECIRVGRAEGAVLEDALEDEIIAANGTAQGINSLHADRLAGRPLEIDARNGAVVRIGQKHGIATPMNRMMVTLLNAAATAKSG